MVKQKLAQFEFIALMASLMSVVALAIDALLPALELIGFSIGTIQAADNQLIIIMIFLAWVLARSFLVLFPIVLAGNLLFIWGFPFLSLPVLSVFSLLV